MHNYPKLCLLACSFVLAYVLYHLGAFDVLDQTLDGYGYTSVFLGGLLFSFGFTTPFAIAIFLTVGIEVHPLLAAPLAGVGAVLSDLCIFSMVRFPMFHDEVNRLRSCYLLQRFRAFLHHEGLSERMRRYLLLSFAGVVIASPLPDEFGVAMLSSMSRINRREFMIVSYVLNTLGILVCLLLGRSIV